jgi:HEAT repeat protein
MADAESALVNALRDASPSNLAAWAATGEAGVRLLRAELLGLHRTDVGPAVHERDVLDNLSAATTAIARAHPQEFLAVFDETTIDDTFVLDGLGQIDDPRATERLVLAAASPDQWRRMHAAIGLGRRASPVAREALERLAEDGDDLVRYHAAASLGRLSGDSSG